jgi:hypothetical protein
MFAAVIAAAAALSHPVMPLAFQRAQVRSYAQAYNAAIAPTHTPYEKAIDFGDDNAFYVGSDEATTISAFAQQASATCPATTTRISALEPPRGLPGAEAKSFDTFTVAKATYYRSVRCPQIDALIAYIDEPGKSSVEAKMRRYDKMADRRWERARRLIIPTFKRLGMKLPEGW